MRRETCKRPYPTEKRAYFVEELLKWFKKNNRNFLPWRQTKNPYSILVAEMMLQKTTVVQVERVFPNFISKYRTPASLSRAEVDEIKQIITPLGMEHRRAPLFKKLGQSIVAEYQGRIPSDRKGLMALEGVGQYIANAVLCLAFNEDVPMLDTNVIRVLIRFFDLKVQRARARKDKTIWEFLESMIPEGKGRDLNLALLDHGAQVCLPRKPLCERCPVNSICIYVSKQKKEVNTQI